MLGEPRTAQLDEARGELTHRWPQVLPGAKAVLFTSHNATSGFAESHIQVQSLGTGEKKTVVIPPAEAYGARPETLMGLSGLGDVILTCSTAQSRNFSVGLALGAGRPIPNMLAEGVPTAEVATRLAKERGISMPVTDAVAAVLAGKLSVDGAVEQLMSRPLRHEAD